MTYKYRYNSGIISQSNKEIAFSLDTLIHLAVTKTAHGPWIISGMMGGWGMLR